MIRLSIQICPKFPNFSQKHPKSPQKTQKSLKNTQKLLKNPQKHLKIPKKHLKTPQKSKKKAPPSDEISRIRPKIAQKRRNFGPCFAVFLARRVRFWRF
jgi:hypothetical protein